MVAQTDWYDRNADEVAEKFESVASDLIYRPVSEHIPDVIGSVLDIGSGSGRDASWLANRSSKVVAIEPSNQLRNKARILHRQKNIQWIEDSLPDLSYLTKLGHKFDLILLNAVWAHIPKSNRDKAFYQMARLLSPGGKLIISIRLDGGRVRDDIHEVSLNEINDLAEIFGLNTMKVVSSTDDPLGRMDVKWVTVVFRSPETPDSGVPLLHRVIYDDDYNGTHKLAMIRTFCHMEGFAEFLNVGGNEGVASFPSGLVGFLWLKFYIPLFANNLPQRKENIGYEKVKFAKLWFEKLVKYPELSLEIGNTYSDGLAEYIGRAIRETIDAIKTGPLTHIKISKDNPLLKFERSETIYTIRSDEIITLNTEYFSRFGTIRLPWRTWQSILRFRPFIEIDITSKWFHRIKHYLFEQVVSGARDRQEIPDDSKIHEILNRTDNVLSNQYV